MEHSNKKGSSAELVRRSAYAREKFYRAPLACALCGLPLELSRPAQVLIGAVRTQDHWGFSEDHIVPRSRGGDDSPENLRPAHVFCNESRGERELDEELREELRSKLLAKPPAPTELPPEATVVRCARCGVAFCAELARIVSYGKRYCGTACHHEAMRERVILVCPRCGIEFSRTKSRARRSRFCSKRCYAQGIPETASGAERDELTCEGCGGSYFLAKSNRRALPRRLCSRCRRR